MAFWKSDLSVKKGWRPAHAAKSRIYSPHSSPMLQKCTIYITTVLCLKIMTATAIHTQPISHTCQDHSSTPPRALMQQPRASAQQVVWAVCYRNAVQRGGFDPADLTDITGVAKLRMSHQRTNTCVCVFFLLFFLSNKDPIFTLTQAYSKCTLRSQSLLGFTPNKI